MSTEMQPLFWRISEQDHTGLEAVSVLMPSVDESHESTVFPTEVSFPSSRNSSHQRDLQWSDEDSDLFLTLLDRFMSEELAGDVQLDLTDNVVQNIVQLVALARFKTPWPTDELVGDDFITVREELDVGDMIAINTQYGFPMAIIVGMDSIDATCVLIDALEDDGQVLVPERSVLVVNRLSVLPLNFADGDTGSDSTWH